MNNKNKSPFQNAAGRKKTPPAALTISGQKELPASGSRPPLPSKQRFYFALLCCGIILCTVFSYRDVGTFDFLTYEDPVFVTQNEQVTQGLHPAGIVWAFTTMHGANLFPVTWLSHMADWQLFGNQPGKHHLMNVALHTINALLVFLLLLYMTGFMWRSAMVALLFALHPIHVESVAAIFDRKDLLSALFWLGTTFAYVWYTRKASWKRMVVVIGLFAMGLMSKPMVVTLPFTLLLLDYWPLNRLKTGNAVSLVKKWRALIVEKWPLFVMMIGLSIVTYIAQKIGGTVSKLDEISLSIRFTNAALSYVRYIFKMLWPDPLSPYYYLELKHINFMMATGAAVFLITLTACFWFLRRKKPYVLTGWLWYLGTLIPMIGIVQVGRQAMADRFAYIPFLGLYIALVWLFSDSVRTFRYRTVISGTVALCIVVAMIAKTKTQVPYWKNTITLFSHALEIDPRGELPNLALGAAYMRQGSMTQAEQYFNRALSYDPHNAKILSYVVMEKAFSLMQTGNFADAGKYLEQGMRLAPSNKDVLMNMASHSITIGKPELAIFYCDRVLAVDPDMVTANVYRAYALQALGRFEDVVRECTGIISRHPDDADASSLLGFMYESGQGVPQDLIQAHFWYTVAAASGDTIVQGARSFVESKMTPAEINRSQELAREWFEKHKK